MNLDRTKHLTNVHNWVLLLLVSSSVLAGCVYSDGALEEEFAPGGLGAPDLPPVGDPDLAPGPFRENTTDLKTLNDFLTGEFVEGIVTPCQPTAMASIKDPLDRGLHFVAIDMAVIPCGHAAMDARVNGLVEQARGDGNEKEVLDELMAEAAAAELRSASAITAVGGPGNAVEAQFLTGLQTLHAGLVRDLDRLVEGPYSWWVPYEDGTDRSARQLNAVFGVPVRAGVMFDVIAALTEGYPWDETKCLAPDFEALSALVDVKLQEATMMGDAYVAENGGPHLWHEIFHGQHLPRFPIFEQHEWWPGMLALNAAADRYLRYWDGLEHPEYWPGLNESIGMLAHVRHEGRTMTNELGFAQLEIYPTAPSYPGYEAEWLADTERGAAAFYARIVAEWPYADLEC